MPDPRLAVLMDRFVRRMHVSLLAKAAEFDSEKVGANGAMVLLTLSEAETTSMAELTRKLNRDKSQMTRSVQALEQKGMLTRQTCSKDARVTLLVLTVRGQALVKAHCQALEDTIDEVLAPLYDGDKLSLQTLLQRGLGDAGAD